MLELPNKESLTVEFKSDRRRLPGIAVLEGNRPVPSVQVRIETLPVADKTIAKISVPKVNQIVGTPRVEGPRSFVDPLIERFAAGDLNAGQAMESTGFGLVWLYERGAVRPRIEPLIEGSALGGARSP